MQKRSPKVEAKIAKTWTATTYFPVVLTYTGIKVIHTAKNISMLKVINFASLNLSGRFRARKAKSKQLQARMPMYPRTHQKPTSEPVRHSMMIIALW